MTARSGWVIHRYESVASTMEHADALARFGAPERSVVVSDEQTAGRGRAGRTWQAPAGSGLFCTLILRPRVSPARLGPLPLLAGVAVAEAMEALTGHAARLKWPNDVWIGDDPCHPKVAGILATSTPQGDDVGHVLIGIGVNVSSSRDGLPAGATSLLLATGLETTPHAVLGHLLPCFDRCYRRYLDSAGAPSLDPWRARAALLGEPVSVAEHGRAFSGMFVGIDDDGALLLATADNTVRRIVAGELTRGPRPAIQPG